MLTMFKTFMLVIASIALMTGAAQAQVASALVIEGLQLPGAAEGQLTGSINTAGVNHAGGWAFTINSEGSLGTLAHVWGNADGGAGNVMRTEDTIGNFQQDSFESFFGISNTGQSAYSPSCTNLDNGTDGLDSVWLDGIWVAMEEEIYPHADNLWWSFGSRPGVTANGFPHFVGGVTDVQGGSTLNRGLFYGLDAAPLLMGGDDLGGVDDPVAFGSSISFDYRFSALGTHYIAEVNTDSPAVNNAHMVIDGTVIQIDGMNVTEGMPVPASAGGLTGETWKNFDSAGVTEDGGYMFTGDTDAATDVDEFICINGVIVHREGDVIDGWTVGGTISYAYLNGDGDYAYVWKVETDEGQMEALFFNDQFMLMVGDMVDMDGNGEPEPDSILSDFTGIAALAIGDRDDDGIVDMYFTADVEIPGVPRATGSDENVFAAAEAPAEYGYEADLPVLREGRAEVEAGFVMPTTNVVAVEDDGAGDSYDLPQQATRLVGAHPNPFNPQTKIAFTVGRAQHVQLAIYDLNGALVAMLADRNYDQGQHDVVWNGQDLRGARVPSGTYMARLVTEERIQTSKVMLVK